jgi:hypothetical protein
MTLVRRPWALLRGALVAGRQGAGGEDMFVMKARL